MGGEGEKNTQEKGDWVVYAKIRPGFELKDLESELCLESVNIIYIIATENKVQK